MSTYVSMAPYQATLPEVVRQHGCMVNAYADMLDGARQLKELARDAAHTQLYELEVRFGTLQPDGRFRAGVAPATMHFLEQCFDMGQHWKRVGDWHVINVYFHRSALPGDDRRLRTETTFPAAGSASAIKVETIVKERVRTIDLRTTLLAHRPSCMDQASDGKMAEDGMDVRVAISRETTIPDAQIPAAVQPTEVHIKERKCYYYDSRSVNEVTWVYTLTRRWTGATYAEAEAQRQSQVEPCCEVEIECVSAKLILSEPPRLAFNTLLVAHSVLKYIDRRFGNPDAYIMQPASGNMLWAQRRQGSGDPTTFRPVNPVPS